MKEFRWTGEEVARGVARRSGEAMGRAAKLLLEKANETVPRDDVDKEPDALERSGKTDHDDSKATVSYGTRYAVKQHEDLAYRHAPPRRAKWLERALAEEEGRLLQIMRAEVSKAF